MTILGSVFNNNCRTPIWLVNEHENLHFDNEQGIHMNSKTYEESGYGLNLDLLTIKVTL